MLTLSQGYTLRRLYSSCEILNHSTKPLCRLTYAPTNYGSLPYDPMYAYIRIYQGALAALLPLLGLTCAALSNGICLVPPLSGYTRTFPRTVAPP